MSRFFFASLIIPAAAMAFSAGCNNPSSPKTASALPADTSSRLFTLLPPEKTGIDFSNNLVEGLNTNVLMYEYFYNGGGVAIGDVNGDGLQDIYFTGNMTGNKLYLNKGHMRFEDVTAIAGVEGRPGPWKTGVAMADVNGDGKLDIYVCYSGKLPGPKRTNQLFINEGNDSSGIPHFKEEAEQYGLADSSFSTQAYFFDYDHDGDLDLLLLNHNPNSLPVLDETGTAALLKKDDPMTGIRLFRNDNGHFHDVTKEAGLSSSPLSYGLGAGIADINGDGWPDIYISNDYSIPDYLYLNNHNGTFTNVLEKEIGHTSEFSMGNDIADINNDGLPDIFTLDMLPADNHRQKLLFGPENYDKFDLMLRNGFYYQYMRNMLQLNNGNGTFSEIGQIAGISNTDWSWSPLFADLDNDGWKDLMVTNGYLRDYTNMDFIKYMDDYVQNKGRLSREEVMELVQKIPSSNVVNYLFRNNGNLRFTDVSRQWGFTIPSNSNGAAYADLDNDGDLDLVINNINRPAFIFENEANRQLKNHFLEINLKGSHKNTFGIGAKVTVYAGGQKQYLEQMPSQGYQSSVSPVLHFGLGKANTVDTLQIVWPGGKEQVLHHLAADRFITLEEKNATGPYHAPRPLSPLFEEIESPIAFRHKGDSINDFKRQRLMPAPMSFFGPCLAKADVNGDGLEDVYAGGGNGQAGALYLRQRDGKWVKKPEPAFDSARMSEDVDAVFFDANGDGHTDLYVVSGGYDQYAANDPLLQDRLYLNDGKGNFILSAGALPPMYTSKSCVRVADVNGDGHPDLFVGGRVVPGQYPQTPRSYLLINDGHGHFKDMTASLAPGLEKAGMVTDAAWVDLNGDGKKDLVVVGEWMPVSIFINVNGRLENKTADYFDKPCSGWWNRILVGDFNHDGHPDLVVGNLGLNSQCRVSDREPADLYYKDFDHNGTMDPILCYFIQGRSYPYPTRDELLNQLSPLRSRFPDYKSYADATLKDIFTADELKGAGHLQVNCLETAYFESDAKGKFHQKELPVQAQYAPVFTITALDYDHDGNEDLLLCGNMNHAPLRFGKYDANYGVLLKGDGKGNFTYIPQLQSGFHLRGDVRSVLGLGQFLLFGINQQELKAYREAAFSRAQKRSH